MQKTALSVNKPLFFGSGEKSLQRRYERAEKAAGENTADSAEERRRGKVRERADAQRQTERRGEAENKRTDAYRQAERRGEAENWADGRTAAGESGGKVSLQSRKKRLMRSAAAKAHGRFRAGSEKRTGGLRAVRKNKKPKNGKNLILTMVNATISLSVQLCVYRIRLHKKEKNAYISEKPKRRIRQRRKTNVRNPENSPYR